MGLYFAKPGWNHVGEYQLSGLPWVTSSIATTSPTQIEFPMVTRFIQIQNLGAVALKLGFTQAGVYGTNYWSVASSASFTAELRIKELFLQASSGSLSYQLLAGLTTIPSYEAPYLSATVPVSQSGFMYNGIG